MRQSAGSRTPELYEGLLQSIDQHFKSLKLDIYYNDPVKFARDVVGCEPTEDQQEILYALHEHGHVAVRSGHGIGKSTAMSLAILWFMSTRPQAKVPVTAPTSHQLFDVLWGELIKWHRQMDERYRSQFEHTSEKFYHINFRESWAVYPRTARPERPEALQGFHGENLLFLIDEAAGVDDRIFEVAEGALTAEGNKVLMAGNPTRLSGFFYDAFHRDRDRWKTLHYSSINSPLVDSSYPERMNKKYGEGSNIYRVRVLGEFPTSEEDQLIPLDLLENAVNRDIEEDYPIVWGLDPARFGSDETALVKRHGDVVKEIKSVRGYNTMQTTGWVAHQIENNPDRPTTIFVDTIGLGAGIADRLRELGYNAVDVNVGERSNDRGKYYNLRAELWVKFRDWLQEGRGSISDDEALIAEASSIKYSFDSAGRIKIERKEDMKKRGLRSPDRADALTLTFATGFFLSECDFT
jgi:hypothetical protein